MVSNSELLRPRIAESEFLCVSRLRSTYLWWGGRSCRGRGLWRWCSLGRLTRPTPHRTRIVIALGERPASTCSLRGVNAVEQEKIEKPLAHQRFLATVECTTKNHTKKNTNQDPLCEPVKFPSPCQLKRHGSYLEHFNVATSRNVPES